MAQTIKTDDEKKITIRVIRNLDELALDDEILITQKGGTMKGFVSTLHGYVSNLGDTTILVRDSIELPLNFKLMRNSVQNTIKFLRGLQDSRYPRNSKSQKYAFKNHPRLAQFLGVEYYKVLE